LTAEKSKNKSSNKALKYSGMAIQMAVLLAFAVIIGRKLDAWLGNEKPYIMLAFLVLALIAYLYKMIKDLS